MNRVRIYTKEVRKLMHAVLDHLMDMGDHAGNDCIGNINVCITEIDKTNPETSVFSVVQFEGDINQDNTAPMWDVEVWNANCFWKDYKTKEVIDELDISELAYGGIPNMPLHPDYETNTYKTLYKNVKGD